MSLYDDCEIEPPHNYERCPKCGCALVERHGKYGVFVGCSNFPNCKFSCSEDDVSQKVLNEIATAYGHGKVIPPKKPEPKNDETKAEDFHYSDYNSRAYLIGRQESQLFEKWAMEQGLKHWKRAYMPYCPNCHSFDGWEDGKCSRCGHVENYWD